jgi:hypothetical protein
LLIQEARVFRSLSPALAAVAVALALPATSQAQAPDSTQAPAIGMRVRIFAPDLRTDRYVGRIRALDGSVMVLDTGEVRSVLGIESGPVLVDEYRRVTIRLSNIQSIDVSGGREPRGGLVRGALFGSLIGGLLIGLGSMPEVDPDANDFIRGVPPGMVIGGLIGAVLGWQVGGERWLPARRPR